MEVDEPSKAAADAATPETVKPVVLVRLTITRAGNNQFKWNWHSDRFSRVN